MVLKGKRELCNEFCQVFVGDPACIKVPKLTFIQLLRVQCIREIVFEKAFVLAED